MSLELRLFISKAQLVSNDWALLLQLFLTVIDVKPNICNGNNKKERSDEIGTYILISVLTYDLSINVRRKICRLYILFFWYIFNRTQLG